MATRYSLEQKKRLVGRINNIKKKDDLKKIKDIILTSEQSVDYTKNNNGFLFQFNSFKDETYINIEKYLNKLDNKKIKQQLTDSTINNSKSDDLTKSSENSSEVTEMETGKPVAKKLRLTNTENHILNRAKYEKEIKKNEREALEMSDNEYYDYNKIMEMSESIEENKSNIFCKNTKSKTKK